MDKARRIALYGMAVSGSLAVLKITAGVRGHSASVSADGMESAADVFASGLVFIGLTIAARPADENHPYGHGRVETLTGLLLGFLLAAAGAAISWHGWTGSADEHGVPAAWTVWPLLVSIAAKLGMVMMKYRQSRRIGSSALLADSLNDGIDILSGSVALGALSLALYDPARFLRADHYGAFAVGLIVIGMSVRVIRDTSMNLIDTMPEDWQIETVRGVALSVAGVEGVEKCFARKTGLKYHVDMHLEVDPNITVRESHEIARRVKNEIKARLPWVADVLVHVEPWLGSKSRVGSRPGTLTP